MAIGELVMQLFAHERFAHTGYGFQPSDDTYVRRIWPQSTDSIVWPPSCRIDDVGGFDALAMAFG